MSTKIGAVCSLVQIHPNPTVSEVLAQLVPPREFTKASFSNYQPDPQHPSQAEALAKAKEFANPKPARGLFGKKDNPASGIYLDGGFGVGKTHLLASIWHEFRGKKAFGSFLAYTSLIGLLGFAEALKQLANYELICIDEFELDDPGDTMLMSRLLSELGGLGIRFATTSNTPPNALGQGRFAASDFAREISAMADKFMVVRVDGDDYRHRPVDGHTKPVSEDVLVSEIENAINSGTNVAVDEFGLLLQHLAKVHPSKYLKLIEGVGVLAIRGVFVISDQSAALRFVSFVDRLYEQQVKLISTDLGLTEVFSSEYLQGGYRKKYLRAISRIGSLSAIH